MSESQFCVEGATVPQHVCTGLGRIYCTSGQCATLQRWNIFIASKIELSVPITFVLQFADAVCRYGGFPPLCGSGFYLPLFVSLIRVLGCSYSFFQAHRQKSSDNTPRALLVHRVVFRRKVIEEEQRHILKVIYFFIFSNLNVSAIWVYLCGTETELQSWNKVILFYVAVRYC